MTRCIIYTRFSPRRNATESTSCENQEAICREYAEDKGWTVAEVYNDEAVSGKEVDRPGLEAALAALGKGDVLLVWRGDRLARDMLLAELIRRRVAAKGARIALTEGDVAGDNDSPEAMFIRRVLDAVHQLEREIHAARTSRCMRIKQKAGHRVSARAPYGFTVSEDDHTKLEPNPLEAQAVVRVLELHAEGLTPWAIKKAMDDELPDACRGVKWSDRTVRKIIRRETGAKV